MYEYFFALIVYIRGYLPVQNFVIYKAMHKVIDIPRNRYNRNIFRVYVQLTTKLTLTTENDGRSYITTLSPSSRRVWRDDYCSEAGNVPATSGRSGCVWSRRVTGIAAEIKSIVTIDNWDTRGAMELARRARVRRVVMK